jgi:hypothetical protein
MEQMSFESKARWRLDLAPAVIAGVFTLLGGIGGVLLDRAIEQRVTREIWRRDVAMRLVERSTGRWTRARTVLMAADSSVFASRWDDYIQQGVTRWNEEYFVLQFGVERSFPAAKKDFELLQRDLSSLHDTLLLYHRAAGSPAPDVKRTASTQLDSTGVQLRKFATLILDSVR